MPVSDNPTLDEVLQNKLLVESFQKHNETKIFDPNPVPFLQAVEKFREAALNPKVSAERLSEMAKQITTAYVKPDNYVQPKNVRADEGNADDFINISNEQSKKTNAAVGKLDQIARGEIPPPRREEMAATFDVAHEEVGNLMSKSGNNLDSWKKTPAFKEAMQTVREVENAENRITQLEKQAEKLQTSNWAKFKAFFSGGADKQIEKIAGEIEKNKMEILLKTDPQKFETLQREKEKMATKLGQKQTKLIPDDEAMKMSKGAAVMLALEESPFGGDMSQKERAGYEKLAAKGINAEKLGQQKQEVEKSVKVGEMLKGQLGSKQSQGQNKLKVK